MNRKIVKSKISHKRYKKPSFERIVIDRETNGKNKKVFKPKAVTAAGKSKSNIEQKFGTVCYCSLKGFKEIIKRMSNSREKFTTCLNQFIEGVNDIVLDEGGLLEKFSNDGILFYFPVDKNFTDGTTRAVITSLKIRYRMNKLNRSWEFYRGDSWQIRIGINTGMVLIDMIEAEDKFTITFKGEITELARKIGSTADAGKILITENSYYDKGFKKGYFKIEDPYHMQPKGIDYTTKVHQVTGMIRE